MAGLTVTQESYNNLCLNSCIEYCHGKERTYKVTRMKYIIISLAICLSAPLLALEKPYAPDSMPDAVTVSAEEVIDMILANPDLIVIDARKRSEYLKGHIEGAINILNTELLPESLQLISSDKTAALLFYCNGIRCLRSADSVKKSASWGYTKIFWFRGGWKEWKAKRLPVVSE